MKYWTIWKSSDSYDRTPCLCFRSSACTPPYSRTRTGGGHRQRRRVKWIEHRREHKIPRKQRRRLAGSGGESTEVILCSLRQTRRCCRYSPLLRVLEDGGDVVYVFEVFGRPSGNKVLATQAMMSLQLPFITRMALIQSSLLLASSGKRWNVTCESLLKRLTQSMVQQLTGTSCVRFLLPTVTKRAKYIMT